MNITTKEIENAAENLFQEKKYSLRKYDVRLAVMLNQSTEEMDYREMDNLVNRIWRKIIKLYY